MLFLIPVLALVRTTVDSEGTAAVTENGEKSLVRHTDGSHPAFQDEGDVPLLWEWWGENGDWIAEHGNKFMVPSDTWLVGIRSNPFAAAKQGGFLPSGTNKAELTQAQDFVVKFECGPLTWEFAHNTHERDIMTYEPVSQYVKHLEGRGLHVLYERKGQYHRPGFPQAVYQYQAAKPVFAGCKDKLTIGIQQTVWLNNAPFTWEFGAGVSTNVAEVTQSGEQILGFEFTQKCRRMSTAEPPIASPNCAAGKRGALVMRVNTAPQNSPLAMTGNRLVMYLEDASHA